MSRAATFWPNDAATAAWQPDGLGVRDGGYIGCPSQVAPAYLIGYVLPGKDNLRVNVRILPARIGRRYRVVHETERVLDPLDGAVILSHHYNSDGHLFDTAGDADAAARDQAAHHEASRIHWQGSDIASRRDRFEPPTPTVTTPPLELGPAATGKDMPVEIHFWQGAPSSPANGTTRVLYTRLTATQIDDLLDARADERWVVLTASRTLGEAPTRRRVLASDISNVQVTP